MDHKITKSIELLVFIRFYVSVLNPENTEFWKLLYVIQILNIETRNLYSIDLKIISKVFNTNLNVLHGKTRDIVNFYSCTRPRGNQNHQK